MRFFLLSLFSLSFAQADSFVIDEHASKKIFSVLTRNGAKIHQLNHQRDREYATQESVHAYQVDCEISLYPSCSLSLNEDAPIEVRELAGQDAWDIGFNLGEAGVPRVVTSNQSHRVTARQIHCIRKGAGKTVTCSAQE